MINLEVKKAKEIIKKLNTLYNNDHIIQWYNEKKVKAYILLEDNIIKAFALLHKIDFDPYKKQYNPYIIDYIYTFEQYRNMGYCSKLLNHIKIDNEIIAFCSNDISSNLFEKVGYIYYGNDEMSNTCKIYRTS